ncbi:MAG TPA: DegT/DnrJ/EryC1/StrS family aminotransferase [Victivallales bacterium]|nr:DegT/DnrJ/EryC1/StrS family aminotransferase [Victivallales bacterium]
MKKAKTKIIQFHRASIGAPEIREVVNCLKSGWLTTGPRVKQFEAEFAKYIGAKFAIAMNSCTAALHLALDAVGLKQNDIVIVPTMTFAATAEVVRYFNAIPVFVDCQEEDFCINPESVEEILNKIDKGQNVKGLPAKHGKVRAVIPVHFGGSPANIPALKKIAKRSGISLVEDCAHACPSYYKNPNGRLVKAGTEADIACYSFYANKTITTGEGGMATTDNPEYENRMRIMSLHGISRDAWKRFTASGTWRYEIVAPGFKYNMPDIMGALGIHQLKRADVFMEERARIARKYEDLLGESDEIITPKQIPNTISSWHLYPIRVKTGISTQTRDNIIEIMKACGIITSVHYMPLHLHKYYMDKYGFSEGDFPVSEKLFSECISLPIYPGLRDSEIKRVAETLLNAVRKNAGAK